MMHGTHVSHKKTERLLKNKEKKKKKKTDKYIGK